MKFEEKVVLLDTTLRDGGYVIDFQFTQTDTELLARALDRIGLPLIEVGHGIGINASEAHGQAAESDVDYVKAARRGVTRAKIGMFCIPGIAQLDHLKACADAGLQFVRIGTNVAQHKEADPFIALAHKLGLFVCTNFMKSYATPPAEFAKVVRYSAEAGSEMIYLVDSAGGMMPDDVRSYFEAMRSATDVMLGFHGHNNLGLAVANSLVALDTGATIIDVTLLGMGRSSGNAPTEILAPLMQRRYGACKNIDPLMLLDLGEQAIAPLIKNRWENTEKTALGLAQVHSMYAPKIKNSAEANGKDYFSLITEVGKRDLLNLPNEVLAASVAAANSRDHCNRALGQLSLLEPLGDNPATDTLVRCAKKTNQHLALNIVLDGRAKARYGSDRIYVDCSPEQALALFDAAPEVIDSMAFPEDARGINPAVRARLIQAAENLENAA